MNLLSNFTKICEKCDIALNEDNPEVLEPTFELKNKITETIQLKGPQTWDKNQQWIYKRLNAEGLFDDVFSNQLDEFFVKESIEFQQLKDFLIEKENEIKKLQDKIKNLLNNIQPFIDQTNYIEKADEKGNENLLYVTFAEALFIENIEQLEKFCRIWNQILMSYSELTHEDTEQIKIHDIESTSITFFAGTETIKALSEATHQILVKYQKILEIKRLKLELKELQLNNHDEIQTLLQNELALTVDDITAYVANDLLKKYDWMNSAQVESIYKQIQISLKQTVNFIERGGLISSLHTKDFNDLSTKIIADLNSIQEKEDFSA